MPVPTHFKFTVRGRFSNSPEAWSYGFHLDRVNPGELDAGFDDVNEGGITSAVTAFMGSSFFSNKIVTDDWRLYQIGTDGRMEGNGPLLHTYDTPLPGGSNGARFPSQCSVVVTLVGPNRGPGKFGRFYLPAVVTQLEDDWRISDGVAGAIRGAVTTFVKAVSDQIDLEVLNQSSVLNISPGPAGSPTGTRQIVDHIEVGRVIDTLRNRRKSLDEARNVGGHIDW